MDSARWEHIQSLFHQAASYPEAERHSFVEAACDGDRQVMEEVLTMLEADAQGGSLLDQGLDRIAYQLLEASAGTAPTPEFGPYRLIRVLGEGGMGVVWLAKRVDAGNLVAIKFLPHAGLSPARRERFAREIKTLAKLNHPFVARLYDAGTLNDGTPWFVMEYVEGVPFNEYCREQGRTFEEQLRLFRSVCEAVQFAHGQEIIHRDLKPSNILVEKDGTPRLLDFGIARELHTLEETSDRTRPGLRFMTPDYAAPEWIREGTVGFYTDVYSLGVILFEMLTGRLPFDRTEQVRELVEVRALERLPEKPSIAARSLNDKRTTPISRSAWNDLDVLCLKAMNLDAQGRYPSVEALVRDIDHYQKGEPLEARPDSLRYRAGKFLLRNRRAVFAASLGIAIVATLVVFFAVRLSKAKNTAVAEAARTERIQQFMLNLMQGGDKEEGPIKDLRVVTLIDRGVQEAQILGKEPEVQADLYQTLGAMYQKLGKLDRASELLELSFKERQRLSDPNYSALADNLIALGLLRSDQGQSKEAEGLVGEALSILHSHDLRNVALLAKANSALGYVLVAAGKYESAVDVLKEAVSLQTKVGAGSPELAVTLSTLADAQLYLGNYSDSNSLYQSALTIDRQVYGDGHPHVSDDLRNLGQLQEIWGHYAEAERYERQAVQISEAWYGKDHPDTARKMTSLAGTLIYENQYAQAEELLNQALTIQQRVYGEMHPSVAFVLNLLGSVANKRGDFKTAEADDQRVIDIYRTAYGDGDYKVAIGMANLASVYFKEKKFTVAEQIFRDVVQREARALSANNINTAITEIKLGRTLLLEKRYREAEKETRTGYEILLKQSSPSTSFVQGARQDLAADYEALNRPQEAQRFRSELATTEANGAKPRP